MKRNCMKKVIALFLTGLMTLGVIGCGNGANGQESETSKQTEAQAESPASEAEKEETGSQETGSQEASETEEVELGYPIADAQELSLFTFGSAPAGTQNDGSGVPFWDGLKENTGVPLDLQFPTEGADWNQTFNLMLTEDTLPDIIFKSTNANEIETLINDGVIYDLTEYLPVYAPDYWKVLNSEEYSTVKRDITTASGKIAVFAAIRENLFGICYTGPVVRKDWLDECGLDEPVTVADWEEMLIAFKDKYNARMGFDLGTFNGSRGISSGFDAYGAFGVEFYLDDDGKVQLGQVQPEWHEMIETLHKWWEMDLIDHDVLTMDGQVLRSKVLNNEIGAGFAAMSAITNWEADAQAEGTGAEWMGVSYLRTAPGAPTSSIRAAASLVQGSGAFITTSCPEDKLIEAIRFLNYGYTEEGYMYWNFGTEGVSYVMGEDGHPQFTDLLKNDPNGLNNAVAYYSGTAGAGIAIQAADMVRAKNVKTAGDAVDKWIENTKAVEHSLPGLSYDADTTTELNDLLNVVSTRCYEVTLQFMTGEEPLDQYDAFVDELYEIGLTRILEILQAAYDAQYK